MGKLYFRLDRINEDASDNEPWAAGTLALTALAWPQDGDYSAHGFVVLDVRDY